MKLSILITGGLGYVGGRIALDLSQRGYKIACGTRRDITSSPGWLPCMQMVKLNWNSQDALINSCYGADCIIHLSAMNEIESLKDPIGALEVNGSQSLRLLEAAQKARVKRFIYFSTAHIYGSPLEGYIDEKKLPCPTHPYAITHRVAEDFVLAAHSQKLIEGIVIRLSNGFGAPATPKIDRWTLLVNDLCRQVVTTGELRLDSPGFQQRNFITLGDIASATSHLIEMDSSKIGNGLFNLGGIETFSILEMTNIVAKRWHKMTGVNPPIIRPEGSLVSSKYLDYSCKKILSTGFNLSSLVEEEIDATLSLCQQAFRVTRV
jgi:UDP-glucose 4-epimerase